MRSTFRETAKNNDVKRVTADGATVFEITVGIADRMSASGRLTPASVWRDWLTYSQKRIAAGELVGVADVDESYDGAGKRSPAVRWDSVSVLADGTVRGRFTPLSDAVTMALDAGDVPNCAGGTRSSLGRMISASSSAHLTRKCGLICRSAARRPTHQPKVARTRWQRSDRTLMACPSRMRNWWPSANGRNKAASRSPLPSANTLLPPHEKQRPRPTLAARPD
jgi:hypothetical protein